MIRQTLFERMSKAARRGAEPMPQRGVRPSRDEVLRQDHASLADRLLAEPDKRA